MATPKTLTAEETEKLLTQLKGYPTTEKEKQKSIRNHTIALLMLDAGLRVGEVVQLRIADLYFNSVPVTSIIIRPEIAKTSTERIIPVSVRLSNALKNMHPILKTWSHGYEQSSVFADNLNRSGITTRQVERIIRSAAMKSLGRPVHPHVLRHTFASNLMRVTDMRTVQELLGHKNLSSTQIYTHPNSEDLTKAINSMDKVTRIVESNTTQNVPLSDIPDRPNTPTADGDMG